MRGTTHSVKAAAEIAPPQGLQAPHGLQAPQAALQGLQAPQAFLAAQGLHAPHAALQGLHAPQAFLAAHGLHAPHAALQGLHAPQAFFAAQGLQAPHAALQGLQAPQGLHFLAAQGLQAPQAALQGLHAPQGLHAFAAHGLQASQALCEPTLARFTAKPLWVSLAAWRFCAAGLPCAGRFAAVGLSVVLLTADGLALLASAGPEIDVRPRATPTVIGTTATVERRCFLLIIRFLPKMIQGFDKYGHSKKVNQRADGLYAGTMRAFERDTSKARIRVFSHDRFAGSLTRESL